MISNCRIITGVDAVNGLVFSLRDRDVCGRSNSGRLPWQCDFYNSIKTRTTAQSDFQLRCSIFHNRNGRHIKINMEGRFFNHSDRDTVIEGTVKYTCVIDLNMMDYLFKITTSFSVRSVRLGIKNC